MRPLVVAPGFAWMIVFIEVVMQVIIPVAVIAMRTFVPIAHFVGVYDVSCRTKIAP